MYILFRFWGIFWVNASTPDTVEQSFREIADEIHTGKSSKDVKKRLASCEEEWLLIIDNADVPTLDLTCYFPSGNPGNILVTTRNPECCQHAPDAHIEIGKMTPEEAISLLLKTQNPTQLSEETVHHQAARIAEELGHLALAVDQARAFISECCFIEDYLTRIRDHRKTLLDYRSVQGSNIYKHSVYTTWEISFEAIHKRNPLASGILQLFTFLHYNKIPDEILERASNKLQIMSDNRTLLELSGLSKPLLSMLRQQQGGNWDPFGFEQAIHILLSFSMVKRDIFRGSCIYSIHPLVHSWARDRLDSETQQFWGRSATYLLSRSIPLASRLLSDICFIQQLLPHVESCWKSLEGHTHNAELKRHEHFEEIVGFALVYSETGKYKQAEELQVQVLEARKKEFGGAHPDTLTSMRNLAMTYSGQGLWKEAEELKVQVLAAREEESGKAHPYTLTSMNNPATTYSRQGRWKEAEVLQLQVLAVCKKDLGETHPNIMSSMEQLAVLYIFRFLWKEAEVLQMQAVEAGKKKLDEAHPRTLDAMNTLAFLYMARRWWRGQFRKAEELAAQVLELRKKELGEAHPDTLDTMQGLGCIY